MSFVHRIDELVAEQGSALVGKADHWERVPLSHVARVVNGFPFASNGFNVKTGKPVIRIRDVTSGEAGTLFDGDVRAAPKVEHGELVIGMDGDFNSRLWPGDTAWLNQRVCKIEPIAQYYSKSFLAYAIPAYLKLVNDNTSAITVKHLSSATVQELPLPLPPRAEQDRVASKIDELFSRIDEGEAALARVEKLVERYRQSVLKAAVTGELTRDWREARKRAGESVDSGEALLARILKARRAAWEAAELKKMKAKGKPPADERWKQKYKEPVLPDTTDLPELPGGWVWASMDQLLVRIEAGKSFKCDERPPTGNEYGVVKVSAVTWGVYDESESKTITDPDRVERSYLIRAGDFLFSRANTVELVGACAIANTTTRRLLLSDKILRFVFAVDLKAWCDLVLKSRLGRDQIEDLSTGNQESMRNIGQQRIARIVLPLPPPSEIAEIIRKRGQIQLAALDVRNVGKAEQRRSSALRQSILKAAFSGQLVPQDPSDEPASKLLERIAAERAATMEHPRRTTKRSVVDRG